MTKHRVHKSLLSLAVLALCLVTLMIPSPLLCEDSRTAGVSTTTGGEKESPTLSQTFTGLVSDTVENRSWDLWDIVLPDVVKDLPSPIMLTVGVLFTQALGWNLTKTNVAKWEMENENCNPTTDPNCTAGGIVSNRGTTYPVAPLLGTHPTQSDVDTYYISMICGELIAMIFMPEIMSGLNKFCQLFTSKTVISTTPENIKTWRLSFGATLLAWEAGSCLYAVTVKKEF